MLRRILQRSQQVTCYHIKCYSSLNLDVDNANGIVHASAQERILKVAVIGTPNAGKSTCINQLMDRKVCATSCKVHTTRSKSQAIFTQNDSQVIFLDTPGLVNEMHQKKHKLEQSFLKDPKNCLREADIIGVVHDVSHRWTREKLDIKIIELLKEHTDIPSILVLNKVDLIKSKRHLLDLTRALTENCLNGKLIPSTKPIRNTGHIGWRNFKDVFMVSALTGNGMDTLRNYLINYSHPGSWIYPAETWTDQSKEGLVLNTVKATLLDFLPQEIPYQLTPQMELFEDTDNEIKSVVLIKTPGERMCKLIAGQGNGRLRQIMEAVQRDLQDAFQKPVRIRLILVPK